MFSYLKGKIAEKNSLYVTIDCNGVGYLVYVPLSTLDKLPGLDNEVKLFIHFSMNDDGIKLFGFYSKQERDIFQLLIGVSRIGPKIGLSILSGLSIEDFISAINENNIKLLSTVPGLGKKSSQRLVVELKDKIKDRYSELVLKQSSQMIDDDGIFTEAENALMTLGYKPRKVKKVLAALIKNNNFGSAEQLIKIAIREIYKSK